MFSPLKNLLNKFRKTASGGSVFAGALKSPSEDDLMFANKSLAEDKAATTHTEVKKEPPSMENICTAEIASEDESVDNDDVYDIELQIKSNTLKKPPTNSNTVDVYNNGALIESNDDASKCLDVVQSCIVIDESGDEVELIISNDSSPLVVEQLVATSSTFFVTEQKIVANADEFVYEEEDEEIFLDSSVENELYSAGELIVFNDGELNSSISSDVPLEDPLAIDEFPQVPLQESINLLESSTNDENSTGDDVLWLNISDIQTDINKPADDMTGEDKQKLIEEAEKNRNNCSKSANEDNAEELRSDGSDSGLGSEISSLQATLGSVADASQMASATPVSTPPTTNHEKKSQENEKPALAKASTSSVITQISNQPRRSNLKRRLELDTDHALDSPNDAVPEATALALKKQKRSINFDSVQVYYFPRQQGFGCVPSAGGCTLGMAAQHVAFKTLTLAEHAAELRRAHRTQEVNPRGSSSDESEESEEDYLSEGSGSDMDAESNGYLQPVSAKQRRALLKAAGVRKIDVSEKSDCRNIRNSREVCGCSCRDFCDPETCACSQAGIKCQVDRTMFPCGCSRDSCGNGVGRIEFNPTRVRTHYIHTVMRLEMENRQLQNPPSCNGGSSSSSLSCTVPATTTSTVCNVSSAGSPLAYYGLQQPQSNYSSGYASPAYTNDSAANYYQQPNTHYGPPLPSTQPPQYQLDSLDAGLFSGSVNATPSYGELMPAYGNLSTTMNSSAYNSINYSLANVEIPPQVTPYSSFHHQTSTNYIPQHHNNIPGTFSSCAVPSVPPFGSATTIADTPHLGDSSFISLSTPTSNADIGNTSPHVGDNSFISLNTPISSRHIP